MAFTLALIQVRPLAKFSGVSQIIASVKFNDRVAYRACSEQVADMLADL